MHIHIFWLFLFLMMLGEAIQYRETYKIKKPFKLRPPYRPKRKPQYRPRWHPPGSNKQRYKSPPGHKYYHSHAPHYSRYPPRYADNDYFEDQSHHQPYVIEIELPKKFGKYNNRPYDRHYDRNTFYDDDYFEEDDDYQTKVVRTGQKRFKVKVSKEMNPKLRIKISRTDNEDEIEEISTPEIIHSLLTYNEEETVQSELEGPSQSDWFPINPPQIYSRHLQVT